MSDKPELAHNDDDGMVYCHLCRWKMGPFASFEMVEAAIQRHLKDAHGKTLNYAVEHATGKRKDTPQ